MALPNAADRKSVREQEKAARLALRQRGEVLKQLMSASPGRQFIWDFLGGCHIFHTTFNGDALSSAFAEGQRSVGLRLLSDILVHCPDLYLLAQQESHERTLRADTDVNRADDDANRLVDPATRSAGEPAGTGPDSDAPGSYADRYIADGEAGWNPGADIYVEAPGGRA